MGAMIECVPLGICSWDYRFEGDGITGCIRRGVWWESGSFEVNGVTYEVEKSGFCSGTWSAAINDRRVGGARKRNPFTRTFDIQWEGEEYALKAEGLGRAMTLIGSDGALSIRPVHPFTRRAFIEGRAGDPGLIGFALWCAILIWKRQANSSGGAS